MRLAGLVVSARRVAKIASRRVLMLDDVSVPSTFAGRKVFVRMGIVVVGP
jgi:hypothetical protein